MRQLIYTEIAFSPDQLFKWWRFLIIVSNKTILVAGEVSLEWLTCWTSPECLFIN